MKNLIGRFSRATVAKLLNVQLEAAVTVDAEHRGAIPTQAGADCRRQGRSPSRRAPWCGRRAGRASTRNAGRKISIPHPSCRRRSWHLVEQTPKDVGKMVHADQLRGIPMLVQHDRVARLPLLQCAKAMALRSRCELFERTAVAARK